MTPEEIVSCIDLTSLNSSDTPESIKALCQKAHTPLGHVAALCCYPEFLQVARENLPKEFLLATVVNFPKGHLPLTQVEMDVRSALREGADEIDCVIPYAEVLEGNLSPSIEMLQAVKALCGKKTLKIIIETGELKNLDLIFRLSVELLEHGADFIKTSTGKTEIGATEEAVSAILKALRQHYQNTGELKGLKVSGGVKTPTQAKLYMNLAEEYFGESYLTQRTFRLGASSLLDAMLGLQS